MTETPLEDVTVKNGDTPLCDFKQRLVNYTLYSSC